MFSYNGYFGQAATRSGSSINRCEQIFQKSKSNLKILGTRRVTGSKFHLENPKILGSALQKFSHNGSEFVHLRNNGPIWIKFNPKTHKYILLRIFLYADIIPPIAGYPRCGETGVCLADKNKLKKDSLVPSCLLLFNYLHLRSTLINSCRIWHIRLHRLPNNKGQGY
jgi:hypothetical protein